MSDNNAPDTSSTADEAAADHGPAAGADDNEGAVVAVDITAPSPAEAAAAASAATAAAAAGAVDTGRRIDPALLQRSTMRRGGVKAPDERDIVAPDGVDGGTGIRVVEPARDFGRGRGDRAPRGEVLDAKTIAARAAENAPAGDGGADRAPRGDRGDRGPRNDRGAGGGGGGPRGDRDGRGDGRGGKGRGGDRGDRGGRKDGPRDDKPREPRVDYSGMAPIVVKRDDDVGDFAAMLAESGGVEHRSTRIGDKLRVTVVHIGSDAVFFEISKTQQGYAARADFIDDKTGELTVDVGDSRDCFVVGIKDGLVLSPRLGKDQIDVGMLEEARNSGIPVDGTITGVNKGGFEVQLGGSSRGFCPTGQIDIHFVEDPNTLIGKTVAFLVREVKEGGKNVVLSRRMYLERERAQKAKALRETIGIGAVLEGTITRIQPFGAFVDLGGLDGLIPISELSFGRVANVEEVVKLGDQVTVEVIRIEDDKKRPGQERIALSLKSQRADPLIEHAASLTPGSSLVGRVVRLESYGAFIELFPGIDGLVHVSEITDRRIRHPEDVLQVDEHVQVRVKEIDPERRRVSLTMREPADDFSAALAAEAAPVAPRAPAKPKLGRGTRVTGVVDRIERYGVFMNLFADGTDPDGGADAMGTALMPASETGTPRGADLGKAFPLGTKVPVLVIDLDDRGRLKVSKIAREQAEERAIVDQFKNDKGAGGKAGLGTFADLLRQKMGG